MWLATRIGFYSITKKDEDEYHVRARERVDLENLMAHLHGQLPALPDSVDATRQPAHDGIFESGPKADYRWRVVTTAAGYRMVMHLLTESVDYANFKNAVHDEPSQSNKNRIYSMWWSDMHRLQNGGPGMSFEGWDIDGGAAGGSPTLFGDIEPLSGYDADAAALDGMMPIEDVAKGFFSKPTPFDAE